MNPHWPGSAPPPTSSAAEQPGPAQPNHPEPACAAPARTVSTDGPPLELEVACPRCQTSLRGLTTPVCPGCQFEFELRCALCSYDLRGQSVTRCPECGLAFDWNDKLQAALHPVPFLFEHNWRRRPIRSFAATFLHVQRPRRFWQSLSLDHPIRIGPLLFQAALYFPLVWIAVLGLHVGALLLTSGLGWTRALMYGEPAPRVSILSIPNFQLWGSLRFGANPVDRTSWGLLQGMHEVLRLSAPSRISSLWSPSMPLSKLAQLLIPFMICVVAFLASAALRQTLGQARIRFAQLFRVSAYVLLQMIPVIALGVMLMSALMILFLDSNRWTRWGQDWFWENLHVIMLSIYGVGVLCLARFIHCAWSEYLRLPHPALVAGLSAAIGALFVTAVQCIMIIVAHELQL